MKALKYALSQILSSTTFANVITDVVKDVIVNAGAMVVVYVGGVDVV